MMEDETVGTIWTILKPASGLHEPREVRNRVGEERKGGWKEGRKEEWKEEIRTDSLPWAVTRTSTQ